ncbi:3230_t:CDS:2 [Funneliformis caledonium]|uniref:3230_t:CDS:1 n=1 Tax=Funneliformis caledonium TaxID=1117310 RepID=A0A9N9GF20_9GLOM|nr:3230_t:CDS:2 [Funneliformis caledonium]
MDFINRNTVSDDFYQNELTSNIATRFSYFQTHFVTIDSNISELNLENNDEILDEVEAENSEFLVITETQLQKYQQLFKKTEIIEGDNLGYLISSLGSQHVTVKGNKRVKAVCDYSFDAKEICLKAFKFVYGIRTTRWENIRTHFSVKDIKARVHKAIEKPRKVEISNSINKETNFIEIWRKDLKKGAKPSPATTSLPGLNAARQWYLFDEVRKHIQVREKQDCLCPEPVIPRPPKSTKKN